MRLPASTGTRTILQSRPNIRFGLRKFPNIHEANELLQTELSAAGVTANSIWREWGVWHLTPQPNFLEVWVNTRQNRNFNVDAFRDWLGARVPQLRARLLEGERNDKVWLLVNTRETRCCRNGCAGCLFTSPVDSPVGRIQRPSATKPPNS